MPARRTLLEYCMFTSTSLATLVGPIFCAISAARISLNTVSVPKERSARSASTVAVGLVYCERLAIIETCARMCAGTSASAAARASAQLPVGVRCLEATPSWSTAAVPRRTSGAVAQPQCSQSCATAEPVQPELVYSMLMHG